MSIVYNFAGTALNACQPGIARDLISTSSRAMPLSLIGRRLMRYALLLYLT